jgi:DNA replication protein DnaC
MTKEQRIEHNRAERAYIEKMWSLRAKDKKCTKCFDTGYGERFADDNVVSEYANRVVSYICPCGALSNQIANEHRPHVVDRPFDSFKILKPHHEPMLKLAKRFVSQESEKWFFAGGAVGSGKTHLCEALVKELFEKTRLTTKSIKWREFAKKVKQDPTNDIPIMELKAVPILYIDDFLKAGGDKVTEADINIAYDIIDSRMGTGRWTIVSSEYTLDAISNIDKSVASRLAQMAANYTVNIKGEGKDVRYESDTLR